MPDESKEKSLEMRVAELEDKLSKLHITEDEMKAYQKVSSLLGQGGGGGISPRAGCVLDCNIVGNCINECSIRACTIRACTSECLAECSGGGGGMIGGGGFGGFGG